MFKIKFNKSVSYRTSIDKSLDFKAKLESGLRFSIGHNRELFFSIRRTNEDITLDFVIGLGIGDSIIQYNFMVAADTGVGTESVGGTMTIR